MNEDNQKYHKSLTNFLKYFINRPNHLAKFLLDNDAIDSKFLNGLEKNKNLNINVEKPIEMFFVDIDHMNSFFKSLTNIKNSETTIEDLKTQLSCELENCLKEERYEDAIRIRDYLKKISNKS